MHRIVATALAAGAIVLSLACGMGGGGEEQWEGRGGPAIERSTVVEVHEVGLGSVGDRLASSAVVESEAMAYLQKSFRVPGAYWRSIEWKEREGKNIKRDRLCDIIVVARFDREADWDQEADARGSKGLYLFEETRRRKSNQPTVFDLDRAGDELELRIYFRYKSGSYLRVRDDIYRDDWKETPVLESLVRAGRLGLKSSGGFYDYA